MVEELHRKHVPQLVRGPGSLDGRVGTASLDEMPELRCVHWTSRVAVNYRATLRRRRVRAIEDDDHRNAAIEPHLVQPLNLPTGRTALPVEEALDVVGRVDRTDIDRLRLVSFGTILELARRSHQRHASNLQRNMRVRAKIREPRGMLARNRDQIDAVVLADGAHAVPPRRARLPTHRGEHCHSPVGAMREPRTQKGVQRRYPAVDRLAGNDVPTGLGRGTKQAHVASLASSTKSGQSTHIATSARQHNDVAIRISYPALAVLSVRIDVRRFEDLGLKGVCALNRRIEIIDLEPQKDTVAVRLLTRISQVWVLTSAPVMKLQDQFAVREQTLVLPSPMSALAVE